MSWSSSLAKVLFMKTFPWRFWITVALGIGLGPGLGVGAGLGTKFGSVWMGALMGISAAIFCVVGVAYWYRHSMRRRDPSFTFYDADSRCEATFELPVDAADAYQLCLTALNALAGFHATRLDQGGGIIAGMTGGGTFGYWSFGAPGERLLATVEAVSANTSRAKIQSKPGFLLVALDFGKNRQNINNISQHINRELQIQYDQAHIAAEKAEMQRSLSAAKLSALQAQIEPHFLYNTLATAQSLTRSDPVRAEQMIGHLIAFLRTSLPKHDGVDSTLGQELDRVSAYLEIMKVRMGARLQYTVKVADEFRSVRFAPMVLQTLVENAIKHGVEPQPGAGTITINSTLHADRLSVHVGDDGMGISAETAGSGIGLKNVRDQLHLIYGNNAEFTLQHNQEKGMTATITIPLGTNLCA